MNNKLLFALILLLSAFSAHAQFSIDLGPDIYTCNFIPDAFTGSNFYYTPKIKFTHGVGKPENYKYHVTWLGTNPSYDKVGDSMAYTYDTTTYWSPMGSSYAVDEAQGYYGEVHGFAFKVTDSAGHVAYDSIYIHFGNFKGCIAKGVPDTFDVLKNTPILLPRDPCSNDSLISCYSTNYENTWFNQRCTRGLFYLTGGTNSYSYYLYFPPPGYTGWDTAVYWAIPGDYSGYDTIRTNIYFRIHDYKHDTTVASGDTVKFDKLIRYLEHFADTSTFGFINIKRLFVDDTTGTPIFKSVTKGCCKGGSTWYGHPYITPTATHKYILVYDRKSLDTNQVTCRSNMPPLSIPYIDTFTVNVTSTGLENMEGPVISCAVSPIPTHNRLMLSLELTAAAQASLTIVDALGREMKSSDITLPAGKSTQTLDVKNYTPGIYYLRLQSAQGVLIKKFIIAD